MKMVPRVQMKELCMIPHGIARQPETLWPTFVHSRSTSAPTEKQIAIASWIAWWRIDQANITITTRDTAPHK
ncbi:hypothetical protein A0H81_14567 [Grifola frondosa]|uniref:Uncharacterized protein n=1 Tax=Grifola frondosa TaxID=5627 RepID=A0A1C7LMH2_GRIFR|nr:hypothetical protein A0H81_14567 [Grifola frondosa]